MDCESIKQKNIVFDFDGTMCLLFKNYKLDGIKHRLHEDLLHFNIEFSEKLDAFDVFEIVIAQTQENMFLRTEALSTVNKIITNAEVEAVETGDLVDGVQYAFEYLVKNGYQVGVATNNSEECVRNFMKKISIDRDIPIVGRVGVRPDLMKPNTWSLEQVIKKMEVRPEEIVFVGDTQRDFECAKRTGCGFIGMAPTDKKRVRLEMLLKNEVMVSNFYELLRYL